MKARKLLSKDILERIYFRYTMGVPVRKLHRDFNVNMSVPLFTKLIEHYEESLDNEQMTEITDTITNSLFPVWLNTAFQGVQSQPKNWKYIGRFPLGAWHEVDNEDN
jgi:hypothetical protein